MSEQWGQGSTVPQIHLEARAIPMNPKRFFQEFDKIKLQGKKPKKSQVTLQEKLHPAIRQQNIRSREEDRTQSQPHRRGGTGHPSDGPMGVRESGTEGTMS